MRIIILLFNLAVSGDGKTLFVVAEEGNALLVVDAEKQKVIRKIKVGEHPHSVILAEDESKAFVSNQWSDNVSVVDLSEFKVTDTLKTGGGPAGLALSADGKFLYAVNSYTSNLSVINLQSKIEEKRLTTGNNPTGIQATPDGSLLFVTSRRTMARPYGDTVICEMTVIQDKTQKVMSAGALSRAYLMENVALYAIR